jgi:hypothetical protein
MDAVREHYQTTRHRIPEEEEEEEEEGTLHSEECQSVRSPTSVLTSCLTSKHSPQYFVVLRHSQCICMSQAERPIAATNQYKRLNCGIVEYVLIFM